MTTTRVRGQGTVRQRSGRWQARVTAGHRRHEATFATEPEAWAWIVQTKAGVPAPAEETPPIPRRFFEDLVAVFKLRKESQWSAGTLAYFECHTERDLLDVFSGRALDSFTSEELEEFLAARRAAPKRGRHPKKGAIRASTVNKLRQQLGALFKYAVKIRWLLASPMVGVDPAKESRAEAYRPRVLRLHEIRAFLAACSPDHRPFFVVLILTGMRRGEIFRLTWEAIDLDRAEIDVDGKTGHDRVPIAPSVVEALRRLEPDEDERTGLVFCGADRHHVPDKGKRLTNKRRAVDGACRRAGIDVTGVGMHTFRHAFSTLLEDLGAPLGVTRTLLRHGNGRTVTTRYLHPADAMLRAALAELDARVMGQSNVIALPRAGAAG